MISLLCRVCLAGDVRMHCIGGDLGLQDIYEKVTSAKLYTNDMRPVTICYICCSQLQKCNIFAEMSRRAEKVLTELVGNGLEIKQQTLSKIPNLAMTATTTLISIDSVSKNENTSENVKEEFNEAEESDLDDLEMGEMLDIEPLETKKSSVIDCNRSSYICDLCSEAFTSKYSMIAHFQSHAEKKSQHTEDKTLCTNSSPDIHEDVNTQRLFVCDHCNKEFTKKVSIRNHLKAHYRIKSCKICNISYSSYQLKKHKEIHETPKICNVCGRVFSRSSSFQRHMRVHSGEKPYACNQCHMVFSQSFILKRHKKISCLKYKQNHKQFLKTMNSTQENSKQYVGDICNESFHANTKKTPRTTKKEHVCHLCGKAFKTTGEMKVHIRIHAGERGYSCNYCIRTFVTKSGLIAHKRIHTGEKPFVCKICDTAFLLSKSLRVHMRKHSEEKAYDENTCNKTSTTYLKSCLRKHLGEKTFVCDFCNKSYHKKHKLKTHILNKHMLKMQLKHVLVHPGENKFSCNNCYKTYSTQARLNQHLRIHSETYHICNVCDKKFSYYGNLTVHMTIHTGLKPYSCVQCDKSFANTSNLKVHNKVYHPE